MCTLFQACSLMLPPGGRKRKSVWLSLLVPIEDLELNLSDFQALIVRYINSRKTVKLDRVVANFGEKSRQAINRLIEKEILFSATDESSVRVRAKYENLVRITQSGKLALPTNKLDNAPKQLQALTALSKREDDVLKLANARRAFASSPVNSLITKGYLEKHQIQIDRDPLKGELYSVAKPLLLSESQKHALTQISELIDCLLYTSPSPRD